MSETQDDLLMLGEVMEVLGKNSSMLMIQSHNHLVQDFLKLFEGYHQKHKDQTN